MAELIVQKDGHFFCDGKGKCGGSRFEGRERTLRCFNCEYCSSFKRDGLKIVDRREERRISDFFKK